MSASLRTCTPSYSSDDEAIDLITSQVSFGLAYVKETHSAYEAGNFEYGEVARKIALNAYTAAVRFRTHLTGEPQPFLVRQMEALEAELDGLLEPAHAELRSIA